MTTGGVGKGLQATCYIHTRKVWLEEDDTHYNTISLHNLSVSFFCFLIDLIQWPRIGFPCNADARAGVAGGDGGRLMPFDRDMGVEGAQGGVGDMFSMDLVDMGARLGVLGGDVVRAA